MAQVGAGAGEGDRGKRGGLRAPGNPLCCHRWRSPACVEGPIPFHGPIRGSIPLVQSSLQSDLSCVALTWMPTRCPKALGSCPVPSMGAMGSWRPTPAPPSGEAVLRLPDACKAPLMISSPAGRHGCWLAHPPRTLAVSIPRNTICRSHSLQIPTQLPAHGRAQEMCAAKRILDLCPPLPRRGLLSLLGLCGPELGPWAPSRMYEGERKKNPELSSGGRAPCSTGSPAR